MFRNETGITLIALIITVIVLLILAGVTLSLTLGERGIFKTASDAKIKTERAEIIEQAKLDIVDKQTENMGKFTESELVEILNKYGTLSDNGEETVLDKTLTSKDGKHEIKVSEIWDGFETKSKKTITFTLMGKTFTAIEGDTWKSWFERNGETIIGKQGIWELIKFELDGTVYSCIKGFAGNGIWEISQIVYKDNIVLYTDEIYGDEYEIGNCIDVM